MTEPEWSYFAKALAWYEPNYGLTGAQIFAVVQQMRAALKDGRISPSDLGMVRVDPEAGWLDAGQRPVWGWGLPDETA